MTYQHLGVEEREEIQQGLWKKESIRSIAKRLGYRTPLEVFNQSVPLNLENAVSVITNFVKKNFNVIIPYPLSEMIGRQSE